MAYEVLFRSLGDKSYGRVIVSAQEVLRAFLGSCQLLRRYDQSGVIMQSLCIAGFNR